MTEPQEPQEEEVPETALDEAETPVFACGLCDKVSTTKAGLRAHERAKHPADDPAEFEAKPEKLKPYPFHDGGVNENAPIRVIRMVHPECPVDPVPELRQKDGSYVPNPRYTGEQNCQQLYKRNSQGVWDVAKCEELGHDPWRTAIRKRIVDDVIDPDTGEVTQQKVKVVVEKRLNIIQVSDNPRHTNGTEVQLAIARGAKFLEDFGVESPCEFRNCTKKKTIQTRYGEYCSERHARLVAADKTEIFLPLGGDALSEDKTTRERNQILDSLSIY